MSRLWVLGIGGVGPLGVGLPAALDPPAAGRFRNVPEGLSLKDGFPPSALRWLDASSLWWLNAARQALGDTPPDPATAQVVALGWGSTPPVIGLIEQVYAGGFASMLPSLFPYSVGNAPAAQAGIHLKLKGATLTLCGKEGAGLAALVEACRYLSAGLMGACVAGSVDHLDPVLRRALLALRRGACTPAGEGAYAMKLESAQSPPPGSLARVAGWASCSAPCPAHRFPDAAVLLPRVLGTLVDRAGWGEGSIDLAALPEDVPALRTASRALREKRLPAARPLAFQTALGACGASWAGAAALAARELASGRARRAVLIALATGGTAWGLALEAPGAQ